MKCLVSRIHFRNKFPPQSPLTTTNNHPPELRRQHRPYPPERHTPMERRGRPQHSNLLADPRHEARVPLSTCRADLSRSQLWWSAGDVAWGRCCGRGSEARCAGCVNFKLKDRNLDWVQIVSAMIMVTCLVYCVLIRLYFIS